MRSTGTTLTTSRIVFGDPGIDHPEQRTVVDVLLPTRRDLLTSGVEEVRDGELLITVGQDKSKRPVRLDVGERMNLVWKAPGELRTLPVELVEVTPGTVSTWLVRAVGPADRGQRRSAVRAPLALPVLLQRGTDELVGSTTDLSEGGLRCTLTAPDADRSTAAAQPGDATHHDATHHDATHHDATHHDGTDPAVAAERKKYDLQVGDTLGLHLELSGGHVDCQVEVVRRHRREDRRTEVSLRFLGLSEATEDLLRRDVFACLRDLRVRGLL